MCFDYPNWISEIEQEARRLASVAFDYREKAKAANRVNLRREYLEKANYYDSLCKEKLTEARILRKRERKQSE